MTGKVKKDDHLDTAKGLPLTLEADFIPILKWYLNATFAIHGYFKSHTSGMLTMGKGCTYGVSSQQRINTKSSMESELVGASNLLPHVVWMRNFLNHQTYGVNESVMYQNNRNSMLLENNG